MNDSAQSPISRSLIWSVVLIVGLAVMPAAARAQNAPYDVVPEAKPPYYRVRYETAKEPGKLPFPVSYTAWIPPGVSSLRGVIVHQHGCGEGSCKSGLTAAFDLHWQALARAHKCALVGPAYEQPADVDCQLWCDPRNGSGAAFQQALADLGEQSNHPELATVPWALWGHSGGGHWSGGMALLHPDRVAAAWLRSGVPLLEPIPERPAIKTHVVDKAVLDVPIMCNPGTKEGVTVKDGRFARVWPANVTFFKGVRSRGGLIGVAVDPLTSHECGNQRYLAIRWFDICLAARLPQDSSGHLRPMPTDDSWLAAIAGSQAVAAESYEGNALDAGWLPSRSFAELWTQYVSDTNVSDTTPPPAPSDVRVEGHTLRWKAEADLQSGLAAFEVERNGKVIASVPEKPSNRFGRPIFQGLQYSDTPIQPLTRMEFELPNVPEGREAIYRVRAVNTVGLKSEFTSE